MNYFDQSFFRLQLDFAHTIAAYEHISLAEALFKYTSLYTRVVGFSNFVSPSQDNHQWQTIIVNLPTELNTQAKYFHQKYLKYERTKLPNTEEISFGCFAYTYEAARNKYVLHFNNNDSLGNLSKDRQSIRIQELRALFSALKNENRPEVPVRITTWLLNLEAFNRLFSPQFIAASKPRNKDLAQDNGWWGQFLDRHGHLKENLATQLRENMKTKRQLIDEYFPLRTMTAEVAQNIFYEYYGV